ncbi:hypothetical protein [Pararhizobium sp.]|uniref:hypothetical protein n=1 Tax=Pararhizobium sp. TaxID=1977563 RepID=UPI003D0B94DD
MPSQTKITPPIAHFLDQIEEARLNLAIGQFPPDGLITPTRDGGYLIRFWDKAGPRIDECPTASEAVMCLTKAVNAALSRQSVARHISHFFYKAYFEAVDARRPRTVTPLEANLCGAGEKLARAMVDYNAINRGRLEGGPKARLPGEFPGVALRVDRLIRRANALYEKVKAEAASVRG